MSKAKIKVALAGVGNCASALIQGVEYYRHAQREEEAVGLSHLYLGGYHPRDIEFVCAFDVASGKVGADLSEAIFTHPNNTIKIADVPKIGVKVLRGPLMDGVSGPLSDVITVDESEEVDVASALKDSGAEILLNLLPSGASEASKRYAEESLKAGCAFVNVTPTILASDPEWAGRFKEKGLPVVGDDLTDQVGATIIHKALLETLSRRGVRISETYQLDVGGGAESLNALERARDLKRAIKTSSVSSVLPYPAEIVAGSTDYVDFLGNRRDSYFWLRGLYFGGVPMRLDIKLSTVDGPNAGSVLLDVIRAVKIALNRGEAGHVLAISAYAFKRPAEILPPDEAERLFEAFVKSG
ncbi:inositol-3-phosphate synthase [Candidatus Bathyarchaeota archaeon]|nr:MAG: inositol-3-phosphate synthase [Candidatus Bathyarchaeota archaeon]RLG98776.1 MAG: inositol-3-phosphate synthase [Candidatus Bathyarchaeota archaeon]